MNGLNVDRSPVRDPRRRGYVAPVKLVCASPGVDRPELLLSGRRQAFAHPGMAVAAIPPGGEAVLDFGRELAGGVRLVSAPNGCRVSQVEITFGESVSEALNHPDNDHAMHRTVLDLPPTGMTEYGNTGFRFVRLKVPDDAPAPLELIGVTAVSLVRELDHVGSFQSSDERLNAIWRTGADTVQLCMQDYIYDGVKRDRMVWAGDLYPEIRTILAVFDEVGTVPETLDFALAHTPEGEWINGISAYSAWWVICLYCYYWRRGDLDYLRRHHRDVERIVTLLAGRIAADGREELDGMRFLDWPSHDDPAAVHAGLQGLLAWCFECAAKLAAWLGDDLLTGRCCRTLELLRRYRPALTGNKSAAAMLALGGLIPYDSANAGSLAVNPCGGLSTFFGTFVLEARARAGDVAGTLEVIRRYWGAMLDCGATTFWEDFSLDWLAGGFWRIDEMPGAGKRDLHADCGAHCYKGHRHSLCHGWAGGVTAYLTERVLGIRPQAPGFRQVTVAPALGGLEWLAGSVPTPCGVVKVEADRRGCKYSLPDGVTAAAPVHLGR